MAVQFSVDFDIPELNQMVQEAYTEPLPATSPVNPEDTLAKILNSGKTIKQG